MIQNAPRFRETGRSVLYFLLSLFLAPQLFGAPFTPGNLVLYRVGDGAAALASSGTAVFLDEYTTAGVLVQSIPVPTTTVGAQRRLVASGTATSEGFLTLSTDGQYVVFSGYDAALATAAITGSTSATVPRVIGRVAANGTIDTSTALTDAISGGNPRGAASTNGTDLWLSGTSAGGGVRYATLGATTSTSLAAGPPTNLRALGIFGGQLFTSSQSGAFRLATVGAGTPTTAGQTIINLPGYPTATTSPYGFFFADLDGAPGLDTVYVADDTGFISKYSLVAGSWTANGTIALATVRGLTGTVSGSNVTLYVTARTTLRTLTDTSGFNATITGALTTLATAAANTAVQGVAFVPASAGPSLSVNDVSLSEGNAGTTSFTFTVSLSAPAGVGGVTFDIATADGPPGGATQPSDYTTNTLASQIIPAGSSTYSFTVLVNGDLTPEAAETFFVNVTNVTGASVTDGQGVGTIVNDDAAPNLTINDVSLNEGNAGTTTFTFTVSLSAPAPVGGVTFDIATADSSAVAPGDYAANTLLGQTIAAGLSTYTFDVVVNGDVTVEPNETFFVNVTNVTNAIPLDGQGLGTIVNDDFTRIHDIQGPGNASPLVATIVTTQGIVTGVKSNGFFIQEPDATIDANPLTSEGIFVFTSAAPPAAAAVGNLVQVVGTVQEFVPSQDPLQPPITEIGFTPTVSFVSGGNPLPAPIPLNAGFPSGAGPIDQLERVEGMRVSVASLTVSGPTGGFVNEAAATATSNGTFYGVVTGVPRPFREPGIQANDPATPPVPVWDHNPEMLRVSSTGLGGLPVDVGAGAVITGLVGPLDYGFRYYTIDVDTGALLSIVGGPTPTPAPVPAGDEFTVASFNTERFFDTVNDPAIGEPVLTAAAFNNRLTKASDAIRNFLRTPDIIGVEEMENLTTLQALATRISSDAIAAAQPDPLYVAYLFEGNDIGGIDVGFLVKTAPVVGATPRVAVTTAVQELAGTLFVNPDASTSLLNDRPPVRLMATVNHANGATYPVTVIVNHLRSLNGVDDTAAGSSGWATGGDRVRGKRQKQAEDLANLVQARQIASPTERIILVGDFNAFEFNDGYVDSMNVITGTPTPDNQTVVPGDGIVLVTPSLVNLFDTPPAAERYSYNFDGSAQSLDHLLVNGALVSSTLARRIDHPRVDSDFPGIARNTATATRLSDHDPLLGYFRVAAFATADLAVTKTDSPDPVTAGTNLTYTITVTNNGPDAAATASWTDTLPGGTTFVSLPAVVGWACTAPAVGAAGTVSCSNASFAVGSAVFTLTVAVAPSVLAGSVLSNTASVTSTTSDSNAANNSATATTTVATSADLSATKVDTPDPVTAGTNLTYTITVSNAGPSNAATVSLNDTLPAGTTFVSLASPGGWVCTTPAVGAGGAISCTIPSLGIGSAVFTLVAQVGPAVAAGTVLSNTATSASATTDPNPGNNSGIATTTVAASADLSVTKVDTPDPVTAGTNLTYTITVSNAGPSNAATVSLTDTIPAGTTFVSLASPGGWACTTPAVGAGGTVSCTNPSLGLGSAVFTLVVRIALATPTGTVITNTATVSSATPDPIPGNGSGTATTTTSCAPIAFTLSTLPNGSVGVAYRVTLSVSGGTEPYSFAVTTGAVPPGVFLSSVSGILSGTPTTAGAFAFTVTATDAVNCSGTASYFVIVGCQTAAGPAQSICQGGVTSGLGGSPAVAGASWSDGGLGGTFLPNASTANASYQPAAGFTGTATLTWTVPSCATPATVAVTTTTAITGSLAAPPALCLGSAATVSANVGQSGVTYLWSVATQAPNGGAASIVGSAAGASVSIRGDVAGPVVVQCVVTGGGSCPPKTFTANLVVTAPPATPTISVPAKALPGSAVTASVPSVSGVTYAWTVTNGTLTAGQGTEKVTFTTGASGSATVAVTETDTVSGCTSSASALVDLSVSAGGCSNNGDPLTLCLSQQRFQVTVKFTNYNDGSVGDGHAVSFSPLPSDSGYFWFFGPSNMELIIKVLDGRAVNRAFWVMYGALSDVGYTITILDTATGVVKTYVNAPHVLASFADVNAFPAAPAGGAASELSPGELERAYESGAIPSLSGFFGARTVQESSAPAAHALANGTCSAGPQTLCLSQSRFSVNVAWTNYNDGSTGVGQATPVTSDSGTFWFFQSTNVELAIKVLDGRTVNNRFWVMYGALSDVQYTITVTDNVTGAVKTYDNPSHVLASVADINAFAP